MTLSDIDVEQLIPESKSTDPHWVFSARSFLSAVVADVAKAGGETKDVWELLTSDDRSRIDRFFDGVGEREMWSVVAVARSAMLRSQMEIAR